MWQVWIAPVLFVGAIAWPTAQAKPPYQQIKGKTEAKEDSLPLYQFNRTSQAASKLRSYGRSPRSMDPGELIREVSLSILNDIKGRNRVGKRRELALSKELVQKVTSIISDLGQGKDYPGNTYPTDEQTFWNITFDKLDDLGDALERRHGSNPAHADAFQNFIMAIEVENDAIFNVERK